MAVSDLAGIWTNLSTWWQIYAKKSGGWGPRLADLVEFLAYSGMRIKSEALWVTRQDIDWPRKEIIVRGDPVTAKKTGRGASSIAGL